MDNANANVISVIVPVYNTEAYLRECVDSVLGQTHTQWELLLVNDGSTDQSGAICDSYAAQDPRIRVIHLDNGGQGRARNRALDVARGEYVCFLDSDDFLPEDALEVMLSHLKQTGVKLIQFASEKIRGDKRIFNFSHRERVEIDSKTAIAHYITGNKEVIQHAPWAKLYASELFQNVRFPESKIYEDSATIYKLIGQCERVAYVPQITYFAREREGSTTRQRISRRNLDRISVYEDMEQYFVSEQPNDKLRRCAVAAQVDAVWNLAAQIYKNMPDGDEKKELLTELKEKGKALRARGIYRDKKARILLCSFVTAPILFRVITKFI